MISISNLSKSFGNHQVISDLSFEVEQGKIFAFLGANGSGKTTTIRCLLDIYSPDEGELLIDGEPYSSNRAEMLGYLPEERGLYLDAPVAETIAYFGTLRGISRQDAISWTQDYLEKVGLADKAKEKIKKLSSGQQQKIQLGLTLVHRPQLLILDEPTKGLDPVNRNLFINMLYELNEQDGTTIIFSTHQMEEAEQIAHDLVMIKDGKRVLYGSVADVKAEYGENVLQLEYSGKLPNSDLYQVLRQETNKAELEISDNSSVTQIIDLLRKSKVEILSATSTTPSLHQVFVMVSQND